MENVATFYKYWREYPDRDREYIAWYPINFHTINDSEAEIWKKREVGYYIHIPFCKQICDFCPFPRYTWHQDKASRYLKVLKQEIEWYAKKPYLKDCKFIVGYYGGGTPTLLSTEEFVDLIEWTHEHFDIDSDAEITVENHPETGDERKLSALYDLGVNRLSMGIQSFNKHIRREIGAYATEEGLLASIKLARKIGFSKVNIDLLFGLPTQTLDDWRKDLEKAIALGLENYSCYPIVVSPGTRLYNRILSRDLPLEPDLETFTAMYEMATDMFSEAGYRHYTTTSDFAKSGMECRRHRVDWEAPPKEYISFGLGTYSYINGYFYCNIHSLTKYMEAIEGGKLPVLMGTEVTAQEKMARFMVLGLKFLEIDKREFKKCFGVELEKIYGDVLQKLQDDGLITVNDAHVRLTQKGIIYRNNVSKMFYSEVCYKKPQPIGVEVVAGTSRSPDEARPHGGG